MAYQYSINMAIDGGKIDAALSNFPLRLYLNGSSGPSGIDFSPVFTELGDAGRKRLSVQTGGGECYVEIAYWSASEGKAVLDVLVPSVAAGTNTLLTLYYDAAEPENTTYVGDTGSTPARAVWDGDFLAVFHLCTAPAASAPHFVDATGNGHDLTAVDTIDAGALYDDTLYAKAIRFYHSAAPRLYHTGAGALVASLPVTMETAGRNYSSIFSSSYSPSLFLGRSTNSNQFYSLQVKGVGGSVANVRLLRYVTYTDEVYAVEAPIAASEALYAAAVAHAVDDVDVWHNATMAHGDVSRNLPSNSDRICLGGAGDTTPSNHYGRIAEARISTISRSAAWIKATGYGLRDLLVIAALGEEIADLGTETRLLAQGVADVPLVLSPAAYVLDDLPLAMHTAGTQYEHLATRTGLAHRGKGDLRTALRLTDGTVLADLPALMHLTDGTVAEDIATRIALIGRAPAFQAVIAQRLRSVKDGL